ncbi:MAG: hypothetical protein WBN89_08905 [Prochlorococcaceae cyanobacterium]
MRVTIALALFSAAAFTTHSLPVRAWPGASINLVRVDASGVTPLPDVQLLLSQSQPGSAVIPKGPAETKPVPTNLTWLLSPGDELEISFRRPLPANAAGVLVLREAPAATDGLIGPGEPGREVERVPFPSPRVFLSEDRSFMAIEPQTPRPPGTITTVVFELGPRVVPEPETPVRFALAQPAVAMERKSSPCPFTPLPGAQSAAQAAQAASQAATAGATGAAAAGAASWVVPVLLGLVVVGVGAAVVAGSSDDGKGDGRNPSRGIPGQNSGNLP